MIWDSMIEEQRENLIKLKNLLRMGLNPETKSREESEVELTNLAVHHTNEFAMMILMLLESNPLLPSRS